MLGQVAAGLLPESPTLQTTLLGPGATRGFEGIKGTMPSTVKLGDGSV